MKILGLKERKYWDQIFSNCDFDFAKNLLISTYSGGIYQKNLAVLLDSYIENPCWETAIELIRFDQDEFLKFFAENRALMKMMQEEGIDTKSPLKTENLLEQEPEFEEYCESFAEDDEDRREALKEILLSKGYTDEVIGKEFVEYMKDSL